jgi:hypothetical protein
LALILLPCALHRPPSSLCARPGRVDARLSSGFMFLLGDIGIILLDLAADRTRPRSLRVSLGGSGAVAVIIAYAMVMLFLCTKIPGYLW